MVARAVEVQRKANSVSSEINSEFRLKLVVVHHLITVINSLQKSTAHNQTADKQVSLGNNTEFNV